MQGRIENDDGQGDVIQQQQQKQPISILTLRMIHFGLMGFGCLVFTLFTIVSGYIMRNYVSQRSKRSSGNGDITTTEHGGGGGGIVNSEYATSYNMHSSSAEERKYMQQQLQQFNLQARGVQSEKVSSSSAGRQSLRQPLIDPKQHKILDQSEEAKSNHHELFQQNSKLGGISSSQSSKVVNKSYDSPVKNAQGHRNQQQQPTDLNLFGGNGNKSSLQFNGQILLSRDEKNIKMHGQFQWSIALHNYKLQILFLLSSLMNAIAYIILAYSLDKVISLNQADQQDESIICYIAVDSYSLVIVTFSMFHQFLCSNESGRSQEENLASGIYLIFMAILTLLIVNIIVQMDLYLIVLVIFAHSLIGLRLLLLRLFIQVEQINISCFVVNIFHLWGEFSFFVIYCFLNKQEIIIFIRQSILNPQSTLNLTHELMITSIYVLSLIFINSSITRQSYFTFNNQFILGPSITLIGLIFRQKFTLWSLIYISLILATAFLLRLIYQSCRALVIENYSQKRKRMLYGKRFQEDQYERLLPTPYTSGQIEGDSINRSLQQEELQFGRQIQPPMRSNYEYYIIENEVSLLLKKRPCLDYHYKFNSIQHFSLRFYAINSFDLSQSQDTNQMLDRQDEQRLFMKAIESYQRKMLS